MMFSSSMFISSIVAFIMPFIFPEAYAVFLFMARRIITPIFEAEITMRAIKYMTTAIW